MNVRIAMKHNSVNRQRNGDMGIKTMFANELIYVRSLLHDGKTPLINLSGGCTCRYV